MLFQFSSFLEKVLAVQYTPPLASSRVLFLQGHFQPTGGSPVQELGEHTQPKRMEATAEGSGVRRRGRSWQDRCTEGEGWGSIFGQPALGEALSGSWSQRPPELEGPARQGRQRSPPDRRKPGRSRRAAKISGRVTHSPASEGRSPRCKPLACPGDPGSPRR